MSAALAIIEAIMREHGLTRVELRAHPDRDGEYIAVNVAGSNWIGVGDTVEEAWRHAVQRIDNPFQARAAA